MRLLFLLPFIVACAPLQEIPSGQAIQGAAVGATATAAVSEAKEVLAPVYPLHRPPIELCRPDFGPDGEVDMEGGITCVAVPCEEGAVCKTEYPAVKDFLTAVKSIVPVHSAAEWLGSAAAFCKKHEGLCLQELGRYEGKKFMVVK